MSKYIIDDRIFTVKFSCDVEKCKGACCTLKGAGGAPLLNEEVKIIKRKLNAVKKYISDDHKTVLDNDGFLEGTINDYSIKSVNDTECIFSYYENGIAYCSFQKAYIARETDFVKPISCHLFPVRIQGLSRSILRYEELYECTDALDKGANDNVTLFEFAEESLVREYGKNFYIELKKKFLKKY